MGGMFPFWSAALLLAPLLAQAQPAPTPGVPTLALKITARYPHQTDAFTEGLVWSDARLLEGTGIIGQSELREVDLRTGEVRRRRTPPQPNIFGEGVAVLGNRVYQLSWQSKVAFVYDRATWKPLATLPYDTEGWGLTTDGKTLIQSDGSATLTWRDPATFKALKKLQVTAGGQPVRNLNELEYVNGTLYANVWLTDRVARIDPASGKVTAWLDLGPLVREVAALNSVQGRQTSADDVANGIAYNPLTKRLLLTGKHWPLLFEVSVQDAP